MNKYILAILSVLVSEVAYGNINDVYQPGQARREKEERKAVEEYQEIGQHIGYLDEWGVRIPVSKQDFFYKATPKQFDNAQLMLYHRLRVLLEQVARTANPETASYILQLAYDNFLNALYQRPLFEPVDYVEKSYKEFIKELGLVHRGTQIVPVVEFLKEQWEKRLAFKKKR